MKVRHLAAWSLAWVVVFTPAAAARLAGVELASRLLTDAGTLELVSCGVRDTLWIEHYVAGLYVSPGATARVVSDPARPKAVRMHVIDARHLPDDIPEKWREALQRELSEESLSRIRAAYRRLSDTDVLTLTYLPQQAVTIGINGETVVHAPGHGVIDSILETWAGRDPITEKLDRLEREHRC